MTEVFNPYTVIYTAHVGPRSKDINWSYHVRCFAPDRHTAISGFIADNNTAVRHVITAIDAIPGWPYIWRSAGMTTEADPMHEDVPKDFVYKPTNRSAYLEQLLGKSYTLLLLKCFTDSLSETERRNNTVLLRCVIRADNFNHAVLKFEQRYKRSTDFHVAGVLGGPCFRGLAGWYMGSLEKRIAANIVDIGEPAPLIITP